MEDLKTTRSFTWTKMNHQIKLEELAKNELDKKCVISDNEDKYTAKEFLDMIRECRIWFQYYGPFC